MKKTISIFLIIIFLLSTSSFANALFNIPLWNENIDNLEVNNETDNNFLNIESESAILIEQSTRKNSL